MSCRLLVFALAAAPLVLAATQQDSQRTSEQVYSNIKVFKGVPASDLLPAMEFMNASMKFKCTSCHDPNDYAAETSMKQTTREMVILQRDINQKYFNGKLEVTCMTCHNGKGHPDSTPLPAGVVLRHARLASPPKPADLIAKHIKTVGKAPVAISRTGTLTAPNDATHEPESKPIEFIQTADGKFRVVSGTRKFGSDGKETWYGEDPMTGEPASIFNRIGRTWWAQGSFAGLTQTAVTGSSSVAGSAGVVVRGNRPASESTEELTFDTKSGLLTRLVNVRRSTIGTVVSAIEYGNYKDISGLKVPMLVTVKFADGSNWKMSFASAKALASVKADWFTTPE